MSPDEVATICEKAAGIIREKGKFNGDLWPECHGQNGYAQGPVCAIGALSIASETHQGNRMFGVYQSLVDADTLDAVANQAPVLLSNSSDVQTIYQYSDLASTTAEDIAQMFERAAKSVTDGG